MNVGIGGLRALRRNEAAQQELRFAAESSAVSLQDTISPQGSKSRQRILFAQSFGSAISHCTAKQKNDQIKNDQMDAEVNAQTKVTDKLRMVSFFSGGDTLLKHRTKAEIEAEKVEFMAAKAAQNAIPKSAEAQEEDRLADEEYRNDPNLKFYLPMDKKKGLRKDIEWQFCKQLFAVAPQEKIFQTGQNGRTVYTLRGSAEMTMFTPDASKFAGKSTQDVIREHETVKAHLTKATNMASVYFCFAEDFAVRAGKAAMDIMDKCYEQDEDVRAARANKMSFLANRMRDMFQLWHEEVKAANAREMELGSYLLQLMLRGKLSPTEQAAYSSSPRPEDIPVLQPGTYQNEFAEFTIFPIEVVEE